MTALVAKAIEKELFAFPLHPLISNKHAYLYGNLILILSFVVIASVLMYLFTFGKRTQQLAEETI